VLRFAVGTVEDEVVIRLQVDPELGRGVERLSQEPGGLGSHAPLASHDLVDPLDGDFEVVGEPDLGESQRLEELLLENHSGMGGNSALG
jgi:hypothetical protein